MGLLGRLTVKDCRQEANQPSIGRGWVRNALIKNAAVDAATIHELRMRTAHGHKLRAWFMEPENPRFLAF